MTPEAAIAGALDFHVQGQTGDAIGVAVSGGSDSTALMHLAAGWARAEGLRLEVATVDHRLRPEAAGEARAVGAAARALGLRHETLVWEGWDGTGNLQAAAREARRRLLAGWSARQGLVHVLLGHTADDQAETVLMRLARGSGVDGLAGIEETDPDALFLRPLLAVRRAALRDWLTARGIGWLEDPSNEDERFDRVKARRALAALEPLGLTAERLIATTDHMRRAKRALRKYAAQVAGDHVGAEAGDLILSREALARVDQEPYNRLFAAAIQWIGSAPYRPRFEALLAAAEALRQGEARTLNGVRLIPQAGGARLTRELAAAAGPLACTGGASLMLWDGRWAISPPDEGGPPEARAPGLFPPGLTIRALGEDIARCEGWRQTGLPRVSLMVTPAVFDGERLIAAPLAGFDRGWRARIVAQFSQYLLSH